MSLGMSAGTHQVFLDMRPTAVKSVLTRASRPLDSITEIVRVQDARAQRESSRRERRNATIGRRWSNVRKRGALGGFVWESRRKGRNKMSQSCERYMIITVKYSPDCQIRSYKYSDDGFVAWRNPTVILLTVCVFVPEGWHLGTMLMILVSRNVRVEKMSHSHSSYPSNGITVDTTIGTVWLFGLFVAADVFNERNKIQIYWSKLIFFSPTTRRFF